MPLVNCFFLVVLALFAGGAPLLAQEAKKQNIQANSGMINYGYQDGNHVFSQFSGRSDIFGNGAGPSGLFSNIGVQFIELLEELEIPAGFSYGFEMARFNQDSQSVYTGSGDVSGPAITMNSYLWNLVGRLYFFNPFDDEFQPYIGVGWGWINGDIHSVDSGFDSRSSFLGAFTTQIFGSHIMLGERSGLAIELRNLRSKGVAVSNDPFGQATSGDLTLDFSGTMLNFTGSYRF